MLRLIAVSTLLTSTIAMVGCQSTANHSLNTNTNSSTKSAAEYNKWQWGSYKNNPSAVQASESMPSQEVQFAYEKMLKTKLGGGDYQGFGEPKPNQVMHQSMNEPMEEPTSDSMEQPMSDPLEQLMNEAMNKPNNASIPAVVEEPVNLNIQQIPPELQKELEQQLEKNLPYTLRKRKLVNLHIQQMPPKL